MTQLFYCLALLAIVNDAGVGASIDDAAVVTVGRRALAGYQADVEVIVNGTSRHGRLIVTGDGVIHIEHLDEPTQRWASAVIRRVSDGSCGWDNRIDLVRYDQRWMGRKAVLAEIRTADASIRISRHQPYSNR